MGQEVERLARKLHEEGEALCDRLAALAPEQWTTPVYTEGAVWTARDLLAHLVSAERGHQQLIAGVSGGGPGVMPGFDVDRYNAAAVADLSGRDAAELLADLRRAREGTVALVRALSDDDLARRGRHPALGEDAALTDFIRVVFMHAKMHLRDLLRALPA